MAQSFSSSSGDRAGENATKPNPFPHSPAGSVAADADATALRQILDLDSLPSTPLPPPKAGARERTLLALSKLDQIPSLQSLARGFTRTVNNPDATIDEVVASISKDQALSIRVLRMANSTEVNSEQHIGDLATATQMLGVNRVRKAADAVLILRAANRLADGLDWRHLWIHALGTAAIAEKLSKLTRGDDGSTVYLAGLLHDVGKIVLSTIAPDEYRAILIATWNERDRLKTLEVLRMGVDHSEAGVAFAKQSKLGDTIIQSIAHHADPEAAESHRADVALVCLANYLAKAHGLGFSGARLDERDGEFEDLVAWKVIEAETGHPFEVDAIEQQMTHFVKNLRTEMAALRDGS